MRAVVCLLAFLFLAAASSAVAQQKHLIDPMLPGGARNIDQRTIRDPSLVQQILEHEALVDDEVGCLVGFNTTLDACRRAILDGELVATRTLEFLAELGEDRRHVAGT